MANMIHINTMREILKSGALVSLRFWKSDGSIVSAAQAVCLSSSYAHNTFNLKFFPSGEIRTVRAVTIFEINNMEVFI